MFLKRKAEKLIRECLVINNSKLITTVLVQSIFRQRFLKKGGEWQSLKNLWKTAHCSYYLVWPLPTAAVLNT